MRLGAALLALGLVACGRQVAVTTAPPQAVEVSLRVKNGLDDAVNVYVLRAGQTTFVGQVGRGVTQVIPLRGLTRGSNVTLRATRADGTRTYTRDSVTLNELFEWVLP